MSSKSTVCSSEFNVLKKLFVSLSKRNQGMFVGGEPKLANIGCESGVLKDILKRRRIVDLIEQ